jgi:O-antigen ligase
MPFDLSIINTSGVSSTTFTLGGVVRAYSPTAGPLHLGALAAVACLVSLGGYLVYRVRGLLLVSALAAFTTVLTLTRANIIALLVALPVAIMPLLVVRNGVARTSRAAVAAVWIGAVVVIGGSFLWSMTAAPSAESPYVAAIGAINPLEDQNLNLRFGYWQDFTQAIAQSPLVGYGTSSAADGFADDYASSGSSYFQPHSIFFKAILEGGIAELSLLVGVLLMSGYIAVSLLRRRDAFGSIYLGCVTVLLVSGLTGPMLDAYPVNLLFWAATGIAATRWQSNRVH